MEIRCWGSRGGIAVSGPEFLKYGGDTTCLEITSSSGEILVVDCGTGIRRLGHTLVQEKKLDISLLLTHAHWDHIAGFPFFSPLYCSDAAISVYGCPFAEDSVKVFLSRTMSPPCFPLTLADARAKVSFRNISAYKSFTIGSINVEPFPLSHPNRGLGYKFSDGGGSFVFLTDNELEYLHPGGRSRDEYVAFCRDADLLIHDAEYVDEEYRRKKGWGHSTYRQALNLAFDAGVRRLGLFHHNQDRTDEQLDAIMEDCRAVIEQEKSRLEECVAVTQGSRFTV